MEHARFCRRCGAALTEDSQFCSQCGTKVEFLPQNSTPVASSTASNAAPTPRRSKTLPIVLCSVAAVLGLIVAIGALLLHNKPTPYAIHSVNGCPGFYDVRFGMQPEQFYDLMAGKYEVTTETRLNDRGEERLCILSSGDISLKLHNIPVTSFRCDFDDSGLMSVVFFILKEDISTKKLIRHIGKYYGESPQSNDLFAIWNGAKTTIMVSDSEIWIPENNTVIALEFKRTGSGTTSTQSKNDQYPMLSFNGPRWDPCNFLANNIFQQDIHDFIDGLSESAYDVDKSEMEGFPTVCFYSFYPEFDYFETGTGNSSIRISTMGDDEEITQVSYIFEMTYDNVINRMTDVLQTLKDEYGLFDTCEYSSLRLDLAGYQEISYDTYVTMIGEDTEGMYLLYWDIGEHGLSLNLTIDPVKGSYKGELTIAE